MKIPWTHTTAHLEDAINIHSHTKISVLEIYALFNAFFQESHEMAYNFIFEDYLIKDSCIKCFKCRTESLASCKGC